MDINYRRAELEDLEGAERVVQEAGNALRMRHGRQPWPAPPPIAFPKFCLAEDPEGLWVAEHGSKIVGFGFSWMTETFWFLSQLFVRPETQARGVVQALLSKTLMQVATKTRTSPSSNALLSVQPNLLVTFLSVRNCVFSIRERHRPRKRERSAVLHSGKERDYPTSAGGFDGRGRNARVAGCPSPPPT